MIVLPGESLDGLDVIGARRDRSDDRRLRTRPVPHPRRQEPRRSRDPRRVRGRDHRGAPSLPAVDRAGASRTRLASGVAYAFDPRPAHSAAPVSFRAVADEETFESSTIRAISTSLRAID